MYESGFQCIDEAIEPTDFCDSHQKVVEFERLQESPWRKMFYRLVAVVLLLLFLIPLVYTIRNLYLGPPSKAQEAW
jgi:hypothetical protein